MKAYIENTQSPLLRNLLKNAALQQANSAFRSNSNSPANASLIQRMAFNPSKKYDQTTIEGHVPDLFKDAVKVGRDYDISKEDALEHLYNPLYSMGDTIESDLVAIYQNKDEGISLNADFVYANIDMSTFGSDTLKKDIDYIASRYATMKNRIESEFSGDEKTANLDKLDKLVATATEKLANSFSDDIAGFFEGNGVNMHKETIRQSVLLAVEDRTAQYTNFIQEHENYVNLNDSDEQLLKKDSAYMASELRKAMKDTSTNNPTRAHKSDEYTLDELDKMYSFSQELKTYSQYISGSTKSVLTGNESEESLGMKLAELKLKGKIFNEYSGVSDKVKDMVNQSIDHFITSTIDSEQAYMNKWSGLQVEAIRKLEQKGPSQGGYTKEVAEKEIAKVKKWFKPIDQNAIYAVINNVEDTYNSTGDANKALTEGAIFAQHAFSKKLQNDAFKGVQRYDEGTVYWNNFFTNTEKHKNNIDSLGLKRPFDGYMLKESGLDNIINSWNSFVRKITTDDSAFLNKTYFMAYA